MKFSIIIPARNEEQFIGKCLDSVKAAARPYPGETEIIVCLNRCTDSTEDIALSHGAKIVRNDSKNLSMIRNAAVRASSGEIVVTIDADSVMTRNMLMEIDRKLASERFVGGGVWINTERVSPGIFLTGLLFLPIMIRHRISAGCFWCYRKDFEVISGFDESLYSAEDIDFAVRLKRYGKSQGKKYGTLLKAYITTSCRKFDQFGDWFFLRKILSWKKLLGGKDPVAANEIWYDVER